MGLLGGRNISLALCLCLAVVFICGVSHAESESKKEIPATKFGQSQSATMTVLYWYVVTLLSLPLSTPHRILQIIKELLIV